MGRELCNAAAGRAVWLQLLGAPSDWVPSGRQQMQVGGVLWVQYLGCNSFAGSKVCV